MKQANVGIYEPNPEEILEHFRKTDFNLFLPYFKKVKNATSVKYILDKIDTIMVQKSRTNFQRGLSYGFLCQNR
jgi:hypothetical protein